MSDTTAAGYEDCPKCEGKGGEYPAEGEVGFRECSFCGGTGRVEINRYLEWASKEGIPPWSPRQRRGDEVRRKAS